jgi:hypothetical protein
MRHKISTVVFSQGWLDGQIDSMLSNTAVHQNEDPTTHLIVSQISEQWAIITTALDDLIAENGELKRRLSVVESAFL